MVKVKVYNKLYKNGKPTGRPFVSASGEKTSAVKDARAANKQWNKLERKSGYTVKVHKVVELTKKGTIKGRRKPMQKPMGINFGNQWW